MSAAQQQAIRRLVDLVYELREQLDRVAPELAETYEKAEIYALALAALR